MTSFRSALVTGATGFIGSALVRRLSSENIAVTCLVRSKQRAAPLAQLPGVTLIEAPSLDTATLAAHLSNVHADVIFHLASYGVHQDARDPAQMFDGNIRLLSDLLRLSPHSGLRRFIHAGTCSEYGLPAADLTPIDETHPLRPTSLYGAAKASAFLYGRSLASSLGIPFITLRLFGVYGPHESPQRLVPYLIDRLRNDQPVDLTPGEQVRDFLYEDDVVDAFLHAADAPNLSPCEAYNVCSSQPVRIRDIGNAIADALDKPRDLLHWGERPYRGDEPMWLVGYNSRFTAATPWRQRITLEDGLKRMVSRQQEETHQHGV